MERKNQDNLNFSLDHFILKIIKLETLLFSDQITKINEYEIPQERNIIITTHAIYNLKIKELRRRIPLTNIIGITISNNTNDFVIHGRNHEYDYYYNSIKRKKIIETINTAWKQQNNSLDFILCRVNDLSLREYVTERNDKKRDKSSSRMPVPTMKCSMKAYLNESCNVDKKHWKSHSQIDKKIIKGESRKQGNAERQLAIKITSINITNFKIIRLLKQGYHSKVVLAEYIHNNQSFAIKIFRKDHIIDKDIIDNIHLERHIMSLPSDVNKFICPIEMIFQSTTRIYFVMPFIHNGELFDFIKRKRILPEEYVKFIAAQIAIAIQSLHDINIIYRDLKPENILFDLDGYIKLIDFGLCKNLQSDSEKAMSFAGTPEFLAPEIITGEGHNRMCDWWSLGALIYEMFFGIPPFYNQNIEMMYELIRNEPLKFPKKVKISEGAIDLLENLLEKNPGKRLAFSKGITEIRGHVFFKGVDFERIKLKIVPPPYKDELIEGSDMGDEEDYADSDIDEAGMNKIRLNEPLFENIDMKNYKLK